MAHIKSEPDPARGRLMRRMCEELAGKTRVTVSTVRRIEDAQVEPGWIRVRRVAAALGLSLADIGAAVDGDGGQGSKPAKGRGSDGLARRQERAGADGLWRWRSPRARPERAVSVGSVDFDGASATLTLKENRGHDRDAGRGTHAMREVTLRDEIHGDIRLDSLAIELLDTPALQRLGRIYQLGYGHLVYRGGMHTRLSHSTGAYYTAQRLASALRRNYESKSWRPEGAIGPEEFLPRASRSGGNEHASLNDRWTVLRHLVGWAALLHDVGHVPVGHTLEDEFDGIYAKHDDVTSPRLRHLWTDPNSDVSRILRRTDLYPAAFDRVGVAQSDAVVAAVLLICTWKERIHDGKRVTFSDMLNERRNEPQAKAMAGELLAALGRTSPWLFAPYMADLVANTISADYLDYLRRDPQNLGLDVLRDDRIVSYFWVGRDYHGQARMALSLVDRRGKRRLDTSTGVVDLVRQRYRFAEIVYYHKTKVSASAMLAKVFRLLGKPPEIPRPRSQPTIPTVATRLREIFDAKPTSTTRRKLIGELRADCMPTALLDPEIGDETLAMLLRMQGVKQLETALKAEDEPKADDALRAIALLDGIARRDLYKTVFTMDAAAFRSLKGRPPPEETERELEELIKGLRTHAESRDALEKAMVKAAGWPECALLLYVPDRKSQAKGIETGALTANGHVATLGSHEAVKSAVEELNKKYAALWRLLVVVHPHYAKDAVGLSAAIEELMKDEIPDANLGDERVIGDLRSCCWFPYVSCHQRPAAHLYTLLEEDSYGSTEIDFISFDRVRWREWGGPEEYALGASVLTRLTRRVGENQALLLYDELGGPEPLMQRVREISDGERLADVEATMERTSDGDGSRSTAASRIGSADVPASVQRIQTALDRICDDLIAHDSHG